MALELIHSKIATNDVKAELEEHGVPLSSTTGRPHTTKVAVKDLRCTQENIKRQFRDGRQFREPVPSASTGAS